jgi:hypothetical protein
MSEKIGLKAKTSETKGKSPSTKPRENLYQSLDSPVEEILHLQQTIGNQAVQRLMKSRTLQAKLRIGQPNDKYELEADRVADQVMRMPEPKGSLVNGHSSFGKQVTPLIQRQEQPEEEEEKNQEEEEEQIQTKPIGDQIMRVPETSCPECNEEEKEAPIQTKPIADQITPLVQRQADEEEEPVQTKLIQRQETGEEEEPIQTKLLQRQETEKDEESVQTKLIQRQASPEEEENVQTKLQRQEEEESVQSKPSASVGSKSPSTMTTVAARAIATKGQGERMNPYTRDKLESRMGVDFSDVRVHSDSTAREAAAGLNAKAFTHKNHIWLGQGQTQNDLGLMAHETSHVIQQTGIVRRKPGIKEPEENKEVEKEEEKAKSTSGESPATEEKKAKQPLKEEKEKKTVEKEVKPAEGAAAAPGSQPGTDSIKPAKKTGVKKETSPQTPVSAPPGGTAASGKSYQPAESTSIKDSFPDKPSKIVEQLQKISPLKVPFQLKHFRNRMKNSLLAKREKHRKYPLRARYRPKAPGIKGGSSTGTGLTAEVTTAPIPIPPLKADEPTESVKPHQHAGSPPGITGVGDLGPNPGNSEGTDNPGLAQSQLQSFLNAVPGSDPGLNTNPGAVQRVNLTGKADPHQVYLAQQHGNAQIARESMVRERERTQDFGENDIAPIADDELLESAPPGRKSPKESRCPMAETIEPFRFDQEDEDELSEKVMKKQTSEYESQKSSLADAENQRDEKISDAYAEAETSISEKHQAAYRDENDAVRKAKEIVKQKKEEWRKQNEDVELQFNLESEKVGTRTFSDIQDHTSRGNTEISDKTKKTQTQAENESKKAEVEAKKISQEGRKESGSWLVQTGRWLKSKVTELARGISSRISKLFSQVRERVKKWFDDLKAWAIKKIEQARQWVINKLEGFRKLLHGLVDRYLGQYPRIARVFKQGIGITIDLAQSAVNATAKVLKKGVELVLDIAAKTVDAALAIVENSLQFVLWALCNLAVTGINMVILLVQLDLEALIELIRDLPEPAIGPLWPIVKAGLIGFLERIRSKPADIKKKFIKKTLWLLFSPAYYTGTLLGVVKGIIWDGLIGTFIMIGEIIVDMIDVFKDTYDFIKRMMSDVESLVKIFVQFKILAIQLKAFLASKDLGKQIKNLIMRSPEILFSMVKQAYKEGKSWANKAGSDVADTLFDFILNNSHFEIGIAVGSVIGQVIFEVILSIISYGGYAAAKTGARALRLISKGLRLLTKGLSNGGGLILKALGSFFRVIKSGLQAAWRFGSGVLKKIFASLQKLLKQFSDWFRRAFKRLPKRKKPGPKKPRNRKARELPFALILAKGIAEKHDKADSSIPVVMAYLNLLKVRFRWIRAFTSERTIPGHFKIIMHASKHTVDKDYTPGSAKGERGLWKITKWDKVVKHNIFKKIYRDPKTGLWWAKDISGHGGSKWKVFKETKKGLEWFKDADKYGNFIVGKHKGSIGKFIPWSELSGL